MINLVGQLHSIQDVLLKLSDTYHSSIFGVGFGPIYSFGSKISFLTFSVEITNQLTMGLDNIVGYVHRDQFNKG